ncbi:MAG: hypothetical protein LBJ46_08905 [Planctomycetota bacterium]|jgi:tetratricopeptide (TPR) repeat protein|nr:hypothetical protein [Planctomycetota bacterium]
MIAKRPLAMLVLAAGIACSASARDARADLIEKAREIFDFQSYMRGDGDAGVEFALLRARDLAGTPLSELAMRLALMQEPALLSSVTFGEAEARRILSSDSPPPEIADLARRYVARAMTYSGRHDEARQIHRQRGLATFWSVAGPFPSFVAPGAGTPDLPAAPELPPGISVDNPPSAAEYQAWFGAPPWRPVPESRVIPVVKPWRWLGGRGDGAVLMRTALDMAEADPRAAFHIRSDLSWTLFIDGAAAAAVGTFRSETPLEHVVETPLAAGWHTVTLMLAPPFDADSAPEAGAALRLESSSRFSWAARAPVETRPAAPMRMREVRRPRYMVELAAAANADPALRAAYAVACREQGMRDEAAWHAALAARADPGNLNLLLFAAGFSLADPLLPEARRTDMAAAWYRRALSAQNDLVPALLFFARLAAGDGKRSEAWEYLERAFAANPASVEVMLERGRWASKFSSAPVARSIWDEGVAAFPDCLAIRREMASLPAGEYWDLERRIEACRAAVAAGDNTPGSVMLLGESLADSGDVQATASAVREALTAFPDDPLALAWAADAYARVFLHDDAARSVRSAIALTPDNPALWRLLGDIMRESGRGDEAVGFWRASLAGDPGQYDLAEMILALSGDVGTSRFDGGYDAEGMVRDADPPAHSGDMVRLLDRSVVVISRDGSHRRLTHEIDLALTRRGGDILADIRPRGELLAARTIFPAGDVLELELFPGRGGLRLPALLPGAARELKFLETFPARDGMPAPVSAWYFQDPAGRTPLLLSEYVVRAPRHFPLVHTLRDFGHEVEFEKTAEGEEDVYRWTARLGLSPGEPDAAHVSERLPFVEVGVAASWEEVTRKTLRRLSGLLIPSRNMLALLSTLKVRDADADDAENTARAIYRFVCDNIDSVPGAAPASHILADRMGDRNILLLAMLRAAGLDAHPAAARPRRELLRPPNWALPGQETFTTPLVRLNLAGAPGPVWLDCRFQALPFGAVADDLSDASVISHLPDGPLFSSLPVSPPSDSAAVEERRVLLPGDPDGEARVVGRSVRRGVAGLVRRQHMAAADQRVRRQAALESLYRIFPDARLVRVDLQQANVRESESNERYEILSSTVVEARPDGALAANLCLALPEIVSRESRSLTSRRTVCHIDEERFLEDHNTFILPEGWEFSRLPSPANIPGNFGTYQLRVARRGPRQVDVSRTCRFPAMRIEPWEWGDFLVFLDRIELAERQWLEYRRVPGRE